MSQFFSLGSDFPRIFPSLESQIIRHSCDIFHENFSVRSLFFVIKAPKKKTFRMEIYAILIDAKHWVNYGILHCEMILCFRYYGREVSGKMLKLL